MRSSRLAVLAVGLGISAGSFAAADAPGDWLIQMSNAARTSNYQGVLVYRGDELLETFRVTHRFADGAERERVQSMTGEVREVLKKMDAITAILPKDRRMVFNRPTPKSLFPALSGKRLEQIAAMYDVKDIGNSRIAGRMCRGITIAPRDAFRYGYELWADRETAVPLKVTLVDKARRGIEQMFFTEVDFPSTIPDEAFERDLPAESIRASTNTAASAITTAQASEPLAEPVVAPMPGFSKLPPGFRVVRHEVRMLPDGSREDHFVLSDGLSAISVFRAVRITETDRTAQRLDQMGAVNAYSRLVGRMHVTVVGEAPQQTVKMIGDNYQAVSAEGGPVASPGAETPANP